MSISIKTFGILSILALAMTFNSCSKDEAPAAPGTENGDNNGNGDVTGEAFTIKAQMGDVVMSRATVKPEDGKSFTWENDDKFALYQSCDFAKKNIFSFVENSITDEGKSANFTCNDFTLASDADYYAFYPQEFTKVEGSNSFSYTIPESVYTQSENNKTDHLKEGMIMVASGKSSELAEGMSFAHKTALFRFGITNLKNESVTVKSIKLYSTDLECFAKGYSFNIDGTESISQKSKELSLSFGDNGIILGTNNSIKAYTLAIPADAIPEESAQIFTLQVEYDDNSMIENKFELKNITVEGEKINQSFIKGYLYSFNIDIDYNKYYINGNYNKWDWSNCQYIYDKGNGIYEGMIYLDSKGTDELYQYKITQYKNWIKQWSNNGNNFDMGTKSCIVQVKTENGYDNVYRWDFVNSWGIVGQFNNWGNDVEMQYKLEGEDHCLIAENVVINGDIFTWKIRPDNSWLNRDDGSQIQINSGSGIKIEGDAESANDYDKNFIVNKGAGTYEFKWYFNLREPKIVVTKKS